MFAVPNEGREYGPFGRLKDVGIAEKIRDVDQQVVKGGLAGSDSGSSGTSMMRPPAVSLAICQKVPLPP
jgi:hypothetical protein